jgi:hypothetical protein
MVCTGTLAIGCNANAQMLSCPNHADDRIITFATAQRISIHTRAVGTINVISHSSDLLREAPSFRGCRESPLSIKSGNAILMKR